MWGPALLDFTDFKDKQESPEELLKQFLTKFSAVVGDKVVGQVP